MESRIYILRQIRKSIAERMKADHDSAMTTVFQGLLPTQQTNILFTNKPCKDAVCLWPNLEMQHVSKRRI